MTPAARKAARPARKPTATRGKQRQGPPAATKAAAKPVATKRSGKKARVSRGATPALRVPDDARADLLAACERGVELARSRGAEHAEVYAERAASLDIELENDRIGTTGMSQGAGFCVRVVRDGRLGFAYWTQADQATEAIARALEQSRLGEPRRFTFLDARPVRRLDRWDDAVARLDVGDALGLARDVLAGAKQGAPKATLSGGGVSLDHSTWALANSAGVAVADRETSANASASLVLKDGERSVSGSESVARHDLRLDGAAVGAEAARTTMALRKPRKADAKGTADLLLLPEAAADLLTGLAVAAATGDEAMRGKTVWSGKRGQIVAAKDLVLADDSWVPGAIGGSPVDGDGQPTKRLPILEGGILRSYLFDAWDAHRHKQPSTASCTRGGFKTRPETGTHHLVLSSPKARPHDKLVAGTDDGYLVESVLGAHTANVVTGDFSVTAPNVWRIEKGAIAGPVTEVAIAGNLPDMLLRLDGVAKEAKAMSGARVPSVRIRDVAISS